MKVKSCASAPMEDIFSAFVGGFADYPIPVMISADNFERRFFYLEGCERTLSYIAYEDEKPVGVVLGAADFAEGELTLHCAALCVLPEYRGRGIAAELFSRYETSAPAMKYHLEVIVGNDKAIHFYRRRGYDIQSDVRSYRAENPTLRPGQFEVSQRDSVSFMWAACRDLAQAGNVGRQNTPQYISRIQNELFFSAREQGSEESVGWLAVSRHGTVHWLFVSPEYRMKGAAGALMSAAGSALGAHNFYASSAGNPQLERFWLNVGFVREEPTMYEMTRAGQFDL